MAIPNYLEGLLSPDQLSDLRIQSIGQGLLGAGQALARSSAPSLMPQGSGFAEGLGAFNQGMQGTFDSALGNIVKGAQVKQMLDKQKQDAALKQLYASALTPQYQTTPAVVPQLQTRLDDQGVQTLGVTPEQRTISGYNFDMQKIVPMLAATGRFDELANIEKAAPLLGGSTMKPSDVAGQVKEAIQSLGIKDAGGRLKTPDKFTDEDRTRVQSYIDKSDINKAPKINTADPTAVLVAQQGNVKEFNTQIKDYGEVARRYNAMVGAWRDKANPTTDSALIYGLAKVYDPQGAVQQGDIATIKGSRSIPQSVVGFAERLNRGGTLTEAERNNIMSTAYGIVGSYSRQIQPQVDTYRSFSKQFGGDPNQIKSPFENLQKPEFITVTVAGKQVKAELSPKDNEYYYKSGDKYYKVGF
jgi:hypothetical protein